jgi:hypothetical protein
MPVQEVADYLWAVGRWQFATPQHAINTVFTLGTKFINFLGEMTEGQRQHYWRDLCTKSDLPRVARYADDVVLYDLLEQRMAEEIINTLRIENGEEYSVKTHSHTHS